jgi:GntP family gluconate:H+ symporter
MITTSAIIASMGITAEGLGCHPAYLCAAIGSGSLVFSWMNDSGFWLFCRMGGISETDTLKSWTVLHIIMGISGFAVCVVLSRVLPLV